MLKYVFYCGENGALPVSCTVNNVVLKIHYGIYEAIEIIKYACI